MLWVVLGFLAVSLLFYCVLGGADFGAGALDLFIKKKHRKQHEELLTKAMGPVWEANHIWLIILIVILFNGFPRVYAQYSIYFHIPLTLMLIGIVFRGCAFTFSHYDAVKDNTHGYYTLAFSISSLLTPIMFGMIIGGMLFGVDPAAPTYYLKYVAPWFNLPSLAIGVFVLGLFAYLASVYLIGEADDVGARDHYIRCAKTANVALIAAGALVFFFIAAKSHHFLTAFFTNPASITCFVAATILTVLFWIKVMRGEFNVWTMRVIAASQVGFVLFAWLAVIFPTALFYTDGTRLSLLDAAAPAATINVLGLALMIGALLFLPVLYYLISIFKLKR